MAPRGIPPQNVVERELPLLLQHEDGHRGELLRDRPDIEHRSRRECNAVLEARHSVATCVQDLPVLVDTERAAWRVGAVEALEDAVGGQRASATRKQRQAQLRFQRLDLVAHRRRRDAKLIRGDGETRMLGGDLESLDGL